MDRTRKSVRAHLNIFRTVCSLWIKGLGPSGRAIGGPGKTCEIDETCATKKRKYGRGTGGPREQRWLFVIVERSENGVKGRVIVLPVRNRTRVELFRYINTYVRPGNIHVIHM